MIVYKTAASTNVRRAVGLGILVTLVGVLSLQVPVSAYYDSLAQNQRYFFPSNSVPATIQEAVLPAINTLDGVCDFTYHGGTGDRDAGNLGVNERRMALPADLAFSGGDNQSRKQSYMDFLRDTYNNNTGGSCSASSWRHDGAAFIVRTMLGYPRGSSATIDDATWTEFQNRIVNNGAIVMTLELSNPTINSHAFGYRTATPEGADFAFYSAATPEFDWMYEFKGGSYYYGVKLRCGNPSGDINTAMPQWEINAQSYVKKSVDAALTQDTISAKPGQKVRWSHDMRNSGPDDMDRDVDYLVRKSGFSNGWNDITDPAGSASGVFDELFVKLYHDSDPPASYTHYNVIQADVGNKICQNIEWTPKSSSDSGTGNSTDACVDVPYDYTLDPSIGSIPDTADPSTQPSIPTLVVNNGPTKSKPSEWKITQVVVKSGGVIPNEPGGGSSSDPCGTYFRPVIADGDCSILDEGNNKVFNGSGAQEDGTPLGAMNDSSVSTLADIGDLEVGTRVCFGLSVKPASSSNNDWIHSPLKCLTIAKKPKLQVWGGDTVVRDKITTSMTPKMVSGIQMTYGSWGQYSVISSGANNAMASGSGLSKGSANNSQASWSKLTFANVNAAGAPSFGNYNSAANIRAVPAIESRLSTIGTATELPDVVDDINTLTDVVYKRTGDLEIKGGTLQAGRSVIISATGKITISGDVRYVNGALTSFAEIPQLVLMAKYINVTQAVTNVDAWLIASEDAVGAGGEINTCSTKVDGSALPTGVRLNSTVCAQPLKINGPVVASKLYLRRTAGSGTGANSDDPAEIINLRPDAYLWAYQRASGAGRAQTVMTTELAPRF